MKILFAGNKDRGVSCFRTLLAKGWQVTAVVAHPSGSAAAPGSLAAVAEQSNVPVVAPADINDPAEVAKLRQCRADLIVLAGYGQIVKREVIGLAKHGCVNLHAGKLPQYRGSSPLNWALINGEKEFGLSIIQVDEGVDTGEVLNEWTFPIGPDDTIADLHATANRVFPEMLLEVIGEIQSGTVRPRKQDEREAAYYPLRFPDDGLILWDLLTAEEIHNRIRALTEPYPGAFTLVNGRRVKLLRSKLPKRTYYGEPGRVYMKNQNGLLVCASDKCLWVARAKLEETGADAVCLVQRYEKFATVRDLASKALTGS